VVRSSRELGVVAALAVVSVIAAALFPGVPATGLVGRYWTNASLEGPPFVEVVGAFPSSDELPLEFQEAVHGPWGAEWSGFLVVGEPGVRHFELRTASQASLYLDERAVAISEGNGRGSLVGGVNLSAGRHAIRVRVIEAGPIQPFDVIWIQDGRKSGLINRDLLAPSSRPARQLPNLHVLRAIGVAIPVIWACLFLYVPIRLISIWTWLDVRRVAPEPRDRRGLTAVLALGFALVIWGINWGISTGGYAPDELWVDFIMSGVRQGFSGGWHDKYPIMHYAVLGLPVSAFELADWAGIIPSASQQSWIAQQVIVRCVSVAMALGTLVTVFLCAVELYGPRRAFTGPLVLLLTAQFLYYGKTGNLDIPSLYWFSWALLSFLRLFRTPTLRDYVLLGAAAAAAVATKDQAYASLALLIPAIFGLTVHHQPQGVWWRRLVGALVDRRLLACAAATVTASVVLHNMLFNMSGFVEHIRELSKYMNLAVVPRTPAGYLEMTLMTLAIFRFSLGWPFAVLALSGLGTAVFCRSRRYWLWMLLVPLSFHLTFTWVELYVCDRYLFPGILVLSLFAGAALADLLNRVPHRQYARAAVGISLAWSLLYAVSVNLMVTRDAREDARQWIHDHATGRARVGIVGFYLPWLGPDIHGQEVNSIPEIERDRPDLVFLNERHAQRFLQDRFYSRRNMWRALENGSLGYQEAFRRRGSLPFWALLQYEPVFRRSYDSGMTNLDKINPETVVYRRTGDLPNVAK
jgi:hypothetical protein